MPAAAEVAVAEVVVAAVAAAELTPDLSDDAAGAIRRHHCRSF
jgi:hypothetical protein